MIKLEGINRIITFLVNGQRFGIRLTEVDKIIRAVEITPIPNGPNYLCGIIDMHEEVVPVVNMHVKIGLPDRPTRIEDRFIIANTNNRVIALRVDEVTEIIENLENQYLNNIEAITSDLDIHGIIRSDDGLILIYNLETFLTSEDFDFLDEYSRNRTDEDNVSLKTLENNGMANQIS